MKNESLKYSHHFIQYSHKALVLIVISRLLGIVKYADLTWDGIKDIQEQFDMWNTLLKRTDLKISKEDVWWWLSEGIQTLNKLLQWKEHIFK